MLWESRKIDSKLPGYAHLNTDIFFFLYICNDRKGRPGITVKYQYVLYLQRKKTSQEFVIYS